MNLRVLWFNWRCIRHPNAGGAEVYTHEVARRLAKRGFDIILVASRPRGLPESEVIDGYRVVRVGGSLTVYAHAPNVYRRLVRDGWRPDVVIDEINTIPFMTPLYTREPIVTLIHQLCWDCWRYTYSLLVEPLGRGLEALVHAAYARWVSEGRVSRVVTVSESTMRDLVKLGYPPGSVTVVYNGLDWSFYSDCASLARDKDNLVVYVGRVSRYKRLEELIRAWGIVEEEVGDARLVIAGRGDERYREKLRRLVARLGLRRVTVKGSVTAEEKKLLLARAKLLVYTSVREGWGQTVIEAAACLAPTVAYRVPGLMDSVVDGETGILVEPGDVKQLADAIVSLLVDERLRRRLAESAYMRARGFTWDSTAEAFEAVLREAAG